MSLLVLVLIVTVILMKTLANQKQNSLDKDSGLEEMLLSRMMVEVIHSRRWLLPFKCREMPRV